MVPAASLFSAIGDCAAGWCAWSLGHNLGHRWWHDDMRKGKENLYAHGEREHHRIYDAHGDRENQLSEDPKESFISFPFVIVAPLASIGVVAYGLWRGWLHAIPFAVWLYGCMALDHRLHILFHKATRLTGILGRFQEMHFIHHETHRSNYFFVSGLIWDLLFRTAQMKSKQRDLASLPAHSN